MQRTDIIPGEIFADPTVDFAFKRIFGSERYKQCTINILNRILTNHTIVDVTFNNTEVLPEYNGNRKSVIDILCTDDKGNKVVVEMQKAKQEHFRERIYFYTSKVIAGTEGISGLWNYELPPTYAISFLDFPSPTPWLKDNPILHYVTKEENGSKMPGSAEFFLFDLKNFDKSGKKIDSALKKWLSLLRDSKLWDKVPSGYQDDMEFAPYFEASRRAAFTKEENQKYTEDMMNEWDIENSKREAVAEALAEGKAEWKNETIINGYKEGLGIEILAKLTNYSVEKVKEVLSLLG